MQFPSEHNVPEGTLGIAITILERQLSEILILVVQIKLEKISKQPMEGKSGFNQCI